MSTVLARLATWCVALFALSAGALAQAATTRPAAQPGNAVAAADVPVKQVVLFSSGVGYFEHFGSVKGDGATELRFQTDQINDVLKSLVLQDLDGGRAGTVTYPSQEPVDRTLKSFQVDITANPGLEDLLNQLRGAKLTANTAGGLIQNGTIIGVQKRQVPPVVTEKGTSPPAEVWVLNVKTGRQIRSVRMDDLKEFTLDDPKLDAELDQALAALAQSRDQEKKPVTINFRGQGERRVRIGYVVETPVWKTSYRLILGDANAAQGGAASGAAGSLQRPGDSAAKPDDAAKAPPPGSGKLQGWAIVENQTDSDWTDVQLSLVSGRPISFIQQLYPPLYVPRPVVWPELYASLRPQTYKGGMTAEEMAKVRRQQAGGWRDSGGANADGDAPDFSLQRQENTGGQGGGGAGGAGGALFGGSGGEETPMDPAASVAAMASAGQLGELFQYTVGNVSLPRQRSAMIPIVTDPIEVTKVSIFNPNALPNHPLTGARVKNTTGKHLLQGPVTVLDAGGYAGDARIDEVPPGEQRLLSYGVDLQVLVTSEGGEGSSTVQSARIVKGVLELSSRDVSRQTYAAQNKSKVEKTLVFEVPLPDSDYKLIEPAQFDEKTDDRYRISRVVKAGEGVRLRVVMESPSRDFIQLGDAEMNDDMMLLLEAKEIPAAVREALAEVFRRRREIADQERAIKQQQEKLKAISEEQTRIRQNLETVSEKTEYYQRLLKKLDEQETTLEGLQKDVAERQRSLEEQRKALAEHLTKLNVG